MTNDFMDGGAFVKAYSSPVTLAKISDTAMKKYAGVCTAIWTSLGKWEVSHARGAL